MKEIQAIPSLGGLNTDDNPENLEKNSYEIGENLVVSYGDDFLRKLKGTTQVANIAGDCFGWFRFNNYSILFIDDDSQSSNRRHIVYKIDHTTNSFSTLLKHLFDLDTSILLRECHLINNEMYVFSNGVDEIMKLSIPMAELTATSSIVGTYIDIDGYVGVEASSGYNLDSVNDSIYVNELEIDADPTAVVDYSLLNYNTIYGEKLSSTKFKTTIPVDLGFEGIGSNFLAFDPITTIVNRGYLRKSTKDYYLINTPPLDPPKIDFITDTNRKDNNIKNFNFQFQTQFVYLDKTVSSLSPTSELLVDTTTGVLDYLNENGIRITCVHPTNYDRDNVKEVVFYVKINEGDTFEFDRKSVINPTLEYYSTNVDAGLTADFYNDSVLIPISVDQQDNLFDRIPKRANSISLIDKSILTMSGVEMAYEENVIDAVVSPVTKKVNLEAQTDWAIGYHYDSSGTEFTKGFKTIGGDVEYRLVNNINNKGVSTDGVTGDNDIENYGAYSVEIRTKEVASLEKSYIYFDFSSTLERGTVFKFTLKGSNRDPRNGAFQKVYEVSNTFIAKTTSTNDLLDEIIDWVNNNAEVHNRKHGNTGDYIETKALRSDDFVNGVTPKSEYSLQIYSGLVCIHSNAGHYNWHQISVLEGVMIKQSFQSYITKTFKTQAVHPVALRYRDGFGRVLSMNKLGVLDLSNSNSLEEYNELQVEIRSKAPSSAVRCDVMLSGNKNFKNFTYAVIKDNTIANSPSTVHTFELDFDSYNDANGASLSYSYTEGDLIQRVADFNSGTSEYDYISDDLRVPLKVLSYDGTTMKVEYNANNPLQNKDLILITTPSLQTEDEDKLYFECGRTFEVIDGLHQGNIRAQTAPTEINAAKSVLKEDFIEDSSSGDVLLMIEPAANPLPSGITDSGTITIFNSGYAGTWVIIAGVSVGGAVNKNGFELVLPYDEFKLSGFNDTDPIYITWEGATNSISTSIFEQSSIFELDNIGDIYLRYRGFGYDTLIESYSISDKYDSAYWGKGRPGLLTDRSRAKLNSGSYYTEPFINNTNLNGISSAYADNFQEYSNDYGSIVKTIEFNGRLMLFHENKVGWVAINRSMISTVDGNNIQARSEEVLSSEENFYLYEGGIGNQPYSAIKFEGGIFFADPYRGNICRISQSGIDIISNVGRSKYFSDLFKDDSVQIYSHFDSENFQLIMHVKSDTLNQQLIWDERRKLWQPTLSIPAEQFLFDRILYSFKSDVLYRHTDESSYNNIYGSQLVSKIKKTFNMKDEVLKNTYKEWLSIMLDPLFTDGDDKKILISNEEGQESEILPSHFDRDGAGHWAEILRDKLSPNMGSLNALLEGDHLQSKTLTVTFKSNSTASTPLNIIALRYIDLENDPKN